MSKQYYVYMMTNKSRTLYAGITNNLERRVYEHKLKLIRGFAKRYNITKLVYYEVANDVHAAIERGKQIKGWLRRKQIALIESMNPQLERFERRMVSRCHPEVASGDRRVSG